MFGDYKKCLFTRQLREWLWYKVRIHYECRQAIRQCYDHIMSTFFKRKSENSEWWMEKSPRQEREIQLIIGKGPGKTNSWEDCIAVTKGQLSKGLQLAMAPQRAKWINAYARGPLSFITIIIVIIATIIANSWAFVLSHLIISTNLLSRKLSLWDFKQ